MRIKTYFAGTVEAALSLASRELGGDALLLAARPSAGSSRSLGAYEVVIGVPGRAEGLRNLRDFLLDQDVHPDLIDQAHQKLDGREASDSEVWASLRDALTFDPWDPSKSYRLAFAGPAGGGKTSTVLKIALRSAQPVRILDGDTGKVGSPLERAAALAGLECSSVEAEGLPRLAEELGEGPLLVDLGGNLDEEWAEALAQAPNLAICLVLPAAWRTADLMAAVERYRALRPSRLVLTHLDETSRCGGALSVAALTQLPLFAFGFSPGLVGGIEPSGERRLLDLLFRTQPPPERAAAAGGGR
jgi:hypothetical protein